MNSGVIIGIEDRSSVVLCRRLAKEYAEARGFKGADLERVGLAVTEAASNVQRHAGTGECVLQALDDAVGGGIGVCVWDDGPGLRNPKRCFEDGYSSAGSAGIGLGAMRRLSDAFGWYSPKGQGLRIAMRLWERGPAGVIERPATLDGWDAFGVAAAMRGESRSGDAWCGRLQDGKATFLLVDGLGHGDKAAIAADRAVAAFRESVARDENGEIILSRMHDALKGSRGAVAAIAEIDSVRRMIKYTGVGNIIGIIIGPESGKRLVSSSGTVGYRVGSIRTYEYDFPEQSMLVMHSDGLRSRWDATAAEALSVRSSQLAATVLLSMHLKHTDDSSILCVKTN